MAHQKSPNKERPTEAKRELRHKRLSTNATSVQLRVGEAARSAQWPHDVELERHTRKVVAEAIKNQRMLRNEIGNAVRQSITIKLNAFGLKNEDRKDLQADLRYLRCQRKWAEQVRDLGLKVFVSCVLTGVAGAAWLGFRIAIGR